MKLIQLLLANVFTFTISMAQPLPSDTLLTVSGEVTTPLKLTMADLMALPHRIVSVVDNNKHETTFEGVDVYCILSLAGIRFADPLEGKIFASSLLIVRAADDYQTVFALTELDPLNSNKATILAYLQNGKPLSAKDGVIRIVSPDEKRHIRWVRQVESFLIQHIN